MKIRVGFGFDVHQLVTGRELWLGGIKFEHELGLLGHSDADVLIHAICDALLGAANMRDIGYHFPDTAGEFKNIDSKILLAETVDLIAAIYILKLTCRIGKMIADITHVGSSKQSIANGMNQYVGIRMAQ